MISRLFTKTSPLVGDSKPLITFNRVVFPIPDGPIKATDSPGSMVIFKLDIIGCENGSY